MASHAESVHIAFRTASGVEDFWRVRRFLLDLWGVSPLGMVWDVRRWDGAYFHRADAGWDPHWRDGAAIGIWETAVDTAPAAGVAVGDAGDHAGTPAAMARMVAAVHPEGSGQAWLHVHPDYRRLEPAMLDWAEANLAQPPKSAPEGAPARPRLLVFADDRDALRLELLAGRGYTRTKGGEHIRRWSGAQPPPAAPLPAGYRLHTMRPGHPQDCERYAALLNAAFKRTFHCAQEIANFSLHSPSFDTALELIAEAPDGSFAALAGMIHDKQNGYGLFEPVCATPGRRPLGLAALLMHEGVRRVSARGAGVCYAGSGYGMPANRFYQAAGFEIVRSGSYWAKDC